MQYCKVKGRWTNVISFFDTTCRYYSHSKNTCISKEECTHKTNDPRVLFIGKRVQYIDDNNIVFTDKSVYRYNKNAAPNDNED